MFINKNKNKHMIFCFFKSKLLDIALTTRQCATYVAMVEHALANDIQSIILGEKQPMK
jgi:hypothetical protein